MTNGLHRDYAIAFLALLLASCGKAPEPATPTDFYAAFTRLCVATGLYGDKIVQAASGEGWEADDSSNCSAKSCTWHGKIGTTPISAKLTLEDVPYMGPMVTCALAAQMPLDDVAGYLKSQSDLKVSNDTTMMGAIQVENHYNVKLPDMVEPLDLHPADKDFAGDNLYPELELVDSPPKGNQ